MFRLSRVFSKVVMILGMVLTFPLSIQALDKVYWENQSEQGIDSDSTLFNQNLDIILKFYQTNIDSAVYFLNRALILAKRNNKKMEEIRLVAAKAYLLTNSGRFADALNSYQLAFDLAQNPESEQHYWSLREGFSATTERLFQLANLHFTYGHLMFLTGNNEGRLFHYQQAKSIATENNDLLNIGYAESGLAIIHLENGRADSALMSIENSLGILQQLENQINTSYAFWIQGNIFMNKKLFDKAYEAYLAGRISAEKQNNLNGIVLNNMGLSQYFLQVDEMDSALYYAYKTYNGRDMQDFQALSFDVALAVENLYRVYESRNQPDSTLKYLLQAKIARDSLNTRRIDNLRAFQKVLMEQQAEQKEYEKKLLIDRTRIRTFTMLSFLIVVCLAAIIIYRSYKQKQRSNIELLKILSDLKSTQAQLIQSEKMASLGELTAGIAHEIQNPLNFVNNFSELSVELLEEVKSERSKGEGERDESLEAELLDDIAQNLGKINHHGKRADAIVKGMLEHSRTSTGEKLPTDINALADEYLRLSYHGLRAKDKSFNADFKADFDPNLPKINVIPQDIGRVLLNIINNAFQATNELSKAHDSYRGELLESFKPLVTVSTKNLGKGIEISIKDNGPGIPDAIKDKIFQPFFTTKPTGQGTGLGLSLSYDIVKAHGGEIRVESQEGKGSNFIMELPVNPS
ncbi:ATP-binding protein [Cecembia sp.]|uniref:sensor histidine kinase n=1 Tax=Cecembia sp. TaxID=1898110 RepID=UPI0025B838E0|nr:ATP-binding protein [Cecembia sp.]